MKLQAKLTTALIALIILFTALAGCKYKDKTSESAPSESTVSTSAGDVFEYDEKGYVKDRLPEELSLGRRNIKILHWIADDTEYLTDYKDGSINEALYYRTQKIEERLECYISIQYEPGNWGKRLEFIQIVYSDVESQSESFDIIGQYSFAAPVGAMYGIYRNLNAVEHLDFEMPWWDKDLLESTEISGKLYFATGDIAPSTIYQNFCLFFNIDMADDVGYPADEIYQMVFDQKWTLEELKTMTKGLYIDLDRDGKPGNGDRFGFEMFDNNHIDAFFYASDMRIIIKDQNGAFMLDNQFTGQKTSNLVDEFGEFLNKNESVRLGSGGKSFESGQAAVLLTTFNYATKKLANVDFKYGVLPVPKYDESQPDYRSCLAAPYTMYSVPLYVKNAAHSGAVMEALASDGYRNISPAIFDSGLKSLYSEGPDAAAVYDIIRQNRIYDVARIYGEILSVNEAGELAAFSLFRNAVARGQTWGGSNIAMAKGAYVEKIDLINSTFEKFQ